MRWINVFNYYQFVHNDSYHGYCWYSGSLVGFVVGWVWCTWLDQSIVLSVIIWIQMFWTLLMVHFMAIWPMGDNVFHWECWWPNCLLNLCCFVRWFNEIFSWFDSWFDSWRCLYHYSGGIWPHGRSALIDHWSIIDQCGPFHFSGHKNMDPCNTNYGWPEHQNHQLRSELSKHRSLVYTMKNNIFHWPRGHKMDHRWREECTVELLDV